MCALASRVDRRVRPRSVAVPVCARTAVVSLSAVSRSLRWSIRQRVNPFPSTGDGGDLNAHAVARPPRAGGPSGGSPGRPRGRPVTIKDQWLPGTTQRPRNVRLGHDLPRAILPNLTKFGAAGGQADGSPKKSRLASHSKSVNIDLSSSDPGHSRAPRSLPVGSGLGRAASGF